MVGVGRYRGGAGWVPWWWVVARRSWVVRGEAVLVFVVGGWWGGTQGGVRCLDVDVGGGPVGGDSW